MGEAQAANNLADAYQRLGRTDEALDLYRRALELNREIGYRLGEGVALVNLGSTLLDLDRAAEAIDYLQQAQRHLRRDRLLWTASATPCTSWAAATYRCGRDAEALECLQQALASHRATR